MKLANTIIKKQFDKVSVALFILLLVIGWVNLYAANFSIENPVFFDTDKEYFKQLIWIVLSVGMIWILSLTDSKFFVEVSYLFLGFALLLLLLVLAFGKEVNGAKAWFEIGSFRLQPAELTKVAVALSISRTMSRFGFSFKSYLHIGKLALIIGVPIILIFLQNDTGSALVYSSFILVFYREGLNPIIMLIGFVTITVVIFTLLFEPVIIMMILLVLFLLFLLINRITKIFYQSLIIGLVAWLLGYVIKTYVSTGITYLQISIFCLALLTVYYLIQGYLSKEKRLIPALIVLWLAISFSFSANYFFNSILTDYQLIRIQVLFGIKEDPLGAGYNVNQSKIAIGSGGGMGKGFLQGTQTKGNFVPEQSTDFIFCTIGEEWGFLGTSLVVILFMALLLRLIYIAERQHSPFSRIYGYCVVGILFFHFAINIGMTIGLAPIIGIPLPLFSYGGSSLWGFTLLIFIFLKLDTNRAELIR